MNDDEIDETFPNCDPRTALAARAEVLRAHLTREINEVNVLGGTVSKETIETKVLLAGFELVSCEWDSDGLHLVVRPRRTPPPMHVSVSVVTS